MTKWPLILAVLFACVQITPVMLIFSFIVGVGHFGFVSGPFPTPLTWASYFLFTVPAMVAFAAYRIRSVVEKKTSYHLTLLKSLVIVLPAVITIHLAEAIITLYQIRDDTTVFITAVFYALVSITSLSYLLATPVKEEALETPNNYNKTKNIIWIILITVLLFIISVIIQSTLIEILYYDLAIADFTTNKPGYLNRFLYIQLFLLPLFIIFAKYIVPKLFGGLRSFLLLLKIIAVFIIHLFFFFQALTYFSPTSILQEAEDYLDQGKSYEAANKYKMVVRYYPDFAAKTPDFNSKLIEVYKLQAKVEEDAGINYRAAMYLEELLKLEPENLNLYDDLGRLYRKDGPNKAFDGGNEAAIEIYKKGLQLDLSSYDPKDVARVYENLGLTYYDTNQLDNAIDSFKKAIQYDPKQSTIYTNLGVAYEKKGMINDSIREYRTALTLEPNDALAHNNLGYSLALQGKINEAIGEFEKALEIDPDLKIAKENLQKYQK